VVKAAEIGFASGYEDGTFKPDVSVTRAEFTKLIVAAFGIEAFNIRLGGSKTKFTDTVGHWAEPYIMEAAIANLIVGIGGELFDPDSTITREDAITILLRVLTFINVDTGGSVNSIDFIDAGDISGYAREAVGRLSRLGVVSGDDRGCFAPLARLTRAEAVKLIVASLDVSEGR
jgi:hypothetical protein